MLNETFTTTLEKMPHKGGWTYVVWPESVVFFGTKGHVRVRVSFDGYETVAGFMPMGDGQHMLPVNAEIRKVIGKEAGETVTVHLFERL